MPSPQTAYDLIKGAMRLIGAIAPSETPTADEASDALATLNDLIETMSTEKLSVWGAATETFNTAAGQAVYTIGPGGNWNTTRPIFIEDDGYCVVNGTSFPVKQWSQADYDGIALKTQQQDIVERFLYVNDNPLGLITLFPVPRGIVPITLNTGRVLTAVPTLATSLVYPPGYMLYMKHALAILLAPDYGRIVSDEVIGVYKSARANVKRANRPKRYAQFDSALKSDGPAIWQRGY